MAARILVLYYSMYGHIEAMAQAAAQGVGQAGGSAEIRRVPEVVPEEVLKKRGARTDQPAPVMEPGDLPGYDGFLIGTPTRFGNMAGAMRNFWDRTGGLWVKGALIGKPAGVFTSTGTQHGGQESTILSTHITLLHHGMVVVGLPYAAAGQGRMDEITGGSPYGAGTLAGPDNMRRPSDNELELMRFQARFLTGIAIKLKA